MNEILHDLYYGKFSSFERKVYRTTENKALIDKIDIEKKHLAQKLSADDAQRLENLESLYLQSSNYDQEDAFAYGFKSATKLMHEIFTE